MPLADHGRLVAGLLHEDGERVVGDRQIVVEGFDPVGVRILAGHQRGATGRADGVSADGVGEHHALGGEAIEGGGGVEFSQMTAVGANGGGGVIVGHDPQNVGLRGLGGRGERANQSDEQKTEKRANGVWLGHDEVGEAGRAMNPKHELEGYWRGKTRS